MTKDKETLPTKESVPEEAPEELIIDLREIYSYKPKDLVPDISVVRYSNLAYINITHRDVLIDFLEMPGVKKDGKVLLNGTRIYMSYVGAQRLAESLLETLEQVHSSGKIEKYIGTEKKEKKSV
jgi:hypothetical protein